MRVKFFSFLLVMACLICFGSDVDMLRRSADAMVKGIELAEEGDLRAAISELSRAIAIDAGWHEAYYHRGRVYYKLDDYDKALADFDNAILFKHDYHDAYIGRGLVNIKLGNYELALIDFSEALILDETSIQARYNRAIIAFLSYDFELSKVDIEFVKDNAEDYDEYFVLDKYLSRISYFEGNFKESVDGLSKYIDRRPEDAESYAWRADAYRSLGDYRNFENDVNKALALDDDYSFAYTMRGLVHLRNGETEKALADYNKALAIDSTSLRARYERALVAYLESDFDLALRDIDYVLADPDNERYFGVLLRYRGIINIINQDLDEGLADISRYLKHNPDDAQALSWRAEIYRLKGEFDKMKADIDKIMTMDEEIAVSYISLGYLSFRDGNLDDAIASYSKAVELDSNLLNARFERAIAAFLNNDFELSRKDIDYIFANADNKDDYSLLNKFLGRLKFGDGEFDKSFTLLNDYLNQNPDDAQALAWRADVHRVKGEFDKMKADIDKAFAAGEPPATAYLCRGFDHFRNERHTEAYADYSKAVELNPDLIAARFERGILAFIKRELDTALDDINFVIDRAGDESRYLSLYKYRGRIHYGKGDFESSVADLTVYLDAHPDDTEALLWRVEAYQAQGMFMEALEDSERWSELTGESIDMGN